MKRPPTKTHTMTVAEVNAGAFFAMGDADTLPNHLDYVYGTGSPLSRLGNSNGAIELLCGEVVVDRIVYGNPTSGRSLQLSSDVTASAAANELAMNLCDTPNETANEYVTMSGNFGTPGEANVVCE